MTVQLFLRLTAYLCVRSFLTEVLSRSSRAYSSVDPFCSTSVFVSRNRGQQLLVLNLREWYRACRVTQAGWTELWLLEAGGRGALCAELPCGMASTTVGVGGQPRAPHADSTLAGELALQWPPQCGHHDRTVHKGKRAYMDAVSGLSCRGHPDRTLRRGATRVLQAVHSVHWQDCYSCSGRGLGVPGLSIRGAS